MSNTLDHYGTLPVIPFNANETYAGDEFIQSVDPSHHTVSLIRHVPDEVMQYIFSLCQDSHPTLSHRHAPVLITHVSSGWRKVALASPCLWSAIKIYLSTYSYISRRGVEDWFGRSQSLPLDIHLQINYGYHNISVRNIVQQNANMGIIDILLSYRYRWRHLKLTLDLTDETTSTRLMSLTPQDVPHLCTLDISGCGSYRRDLGTRNFSLLSFPSLKKLTGFLFHDLNIRRAYIHWINLTELFFYSIRGSEEITQFVDILRQCASLVRLTYNTYGSVPEAQQGAAIKLPYLRYLHASEVVSDRIGIWLITVLRAPELESLLFRTQTASQYVPEALITFLKHSPNVIHLIILGQKMDVDLFIEALHYCPRLESLPSFPHLTDSNGQNHMVYDKVLSRFVDADELGHVLCPDLGRLTVYLRGGVFLPYLRFRVLEALILRKTEPCSGLAPWSTLNLNIRCKSEDKAAVDALLSRVAHHPGIDIKVLF